MSEYIGLDYGMGLSNRDKKNPQFHFGVISQNEVLQAWADSSEAIYPEDDTEENDFSEPLGFCLDDKDYFATCGEDGDIFIERSPYYTLCNYCSPCAPGAGDIMNQNTEGIKAYCFGPDFFDAEDDIPIDIYSVETGKLIAKKGQKIA